MGDSVSAKSPAPTVLPRWVSTIARGSTTTVEQKVDMAKEQ